MSNDLLIAARSIYFVDANVCVQSFENIRWMELNHHLPYNGWTFCTSDGFLKNTANCRGYPANNKTKDPLCELLYCLEMRVMSLI